MRGRMAKVIIAGGRDIEWVNIDFIIRKACKSWNITVEDIEEVVSGGARGIDYLGEVWANDNGIPVVRFEADWNKYGPAAGPIRNREMAEYVKKSGYLFSVWDGKSKGTKNMIKEAQERFIPTWIERV